MIKNIKIRTLVVLGAGILFLSLSVFSQNPRRPDVGFQAGNSYALSDIETINTRNGNMMLTVPLASLPAGRGSSGGFTLNLYYNSKIWNGRQEIFDNTTPPSGNPSYCDQFPSQGYRYTIENLEQSGEGGWYLGGYYDLAVTNRIDHEGLTPESDTETFAKNYYKWKVQVRYPDGSLHDFVPAIGAGSYFNDGYFNIDINGQERNGSSQVSSDSCGWRVSNSANQLTTSGMNYYSTDGSYTRLFIPYQANGNQMGGVRPWTLFMPDGTIMEKFPADAPAVTQRIVDRNGNRITFDINGITDDAGRNIFTRQITNQNGEAVTEIVQKGFAGEELVTQVVFKSNYVYRQYKAIDISEVIPPGTERTKEVFADFQVVDRIVLPAQSGSRQYQFDYYGDDVQPTSGNYTTDGWGEMKSIELPGGAKANYTYQYPDPVNTVGTTSSTVLENGVIRKDLTYNEEYDGATISKTDTWQYSYSAAGGGFIGPDGAGSYERLPLGAPGSFSNLSYRSHYSNKWVERLWRENQPATNLTSGNLTTSLNAYVKTEFTTILDNSGQPALTAIKDFEYDKNGNVIKVTEYDWVTFGSVPRQTSGNDPIGRVTGIPGGAAIKRITVNSYYNQTPNAAATNVTDPNVYVFSSSPLLKGLLKTTEIQNSNGNPVSRSEFIYDNSPTAPTKGNMTETRTWDSTKAATLGSADANGFRLNSSNSVSTTAIYDQYGNLTLATDAKGNQTQITYGDIVTSSGTVNALYPTQTTAAYGTAIAQTATAEYDFNTGLVKSSTTLGNTSSENVTNATEYDALGRPTKVKAAVGTPLEIWTQTEYDDVNRRIVVRSDIETKGDGKKVAVQHYDQLGRVRLSRSIENALTENPYIEADGIKVQTRYQTGNPYSYQWTSNPYRATTSTAATNEPSMGWTRSKSLNTGKHSEVETFSGAAFPGTAIGSTASTGVVQTDIDADRTLVTDQSGKQRISQTNALGQLINVWEVTAADSATEAITFGGSGLNAYKTSYSYDTLNNLTTVNQGMQTRSFSYSSLSRLLSANNPESGTISYSYDNNGNLITKTDARQIVTSYVYDALNRVTNRNYSAPTGLPNYQAAPNVVYTYDDPAIANSKGRLTKVAAIAGANVTAETKYQAFDILGRVVQSQQWVDGANYGEPMTYAYDLSGAMIEQKYPSGRVVKNVLDNDGDLAIVESKKSASDIYRTYANSFIYTAAGAVSSVRLGNGKFENTQFNSRLQPVQIGLGSSATDQNLLKLNFDYGTTNNNGNVLSQMIAVPTVGATTGFTATQAYTYDSLNRLKSAEETIPNQTGWKQTFKYDRYGNRNFDTTNIGDTTTIPAGCAVAVCNPQVDPNTNKLIGYQFDNAGNTKVDAENRTFIYDGENKQVEVKDQYGISIGKYFYDGDGKRVKKISNTETTIFVYNAGGQLVAEYSTQISQQPQVSYLTSDHLGSPRINTDQNGAVISRHDYQPFGEKIQRASYGADNVRQKFTSYERDEETEEDFAEARYYNYKLGRFNSVDPLMASANINFPQTFNRYEYVMNNPLNLTDPSGMKASCPEGQKCELDEDGNEYYIKDENRIYTSSITEQVIITATAAGVAAIGYAKTTGIQVAKKSGNGLGWLLGKIWGGAKVAGNFTANAVSGAVFFILANPIPNPVLECMEKTGDELCQVKMSSQEGAGVDEGENPDKTDNEPSGNTNKEKQKAKKKNPCDFGDPNTPIQDQLAGQGQLRDLRSNPNLSGVDINSVLTMTPAELAEAVKRGNISSNVCKQIKKAFEKRDLGKRGKNKK